MDAVSEATPSAVAKVPHPMFVLSYEQKNITSDITPYVRSVTYTDYLSGQSDEVEVELEDTDGRWVRAWYPGKGDRLTLKIGYEGEPLLPCGVFEIDEIEFSQPPAVVSIRGLATGVNTTVRTRKSGAYENTTLAAIAQRVAKRNKLTLTGRIRQIQIDRVTQYQERDVEFLKRLANEYGYAFKIVGRKLVFTELENLRETDAVKTITATDVISIRMRDKIKDVYKEAKVKYHDPKAKKLVVYSLKADQAAGGTSGKSASGDTLKLATRSGSKGAAQAKAKAAMDKANLQQTTGTLTIPGTPKLVAGSTFDLVDCGKLTGKYLADSARHRLERGGGYTTELEVKRASLEVSKSKSKAAAKSKTKKAPAKKPGKTLVVYGVKSDGQVGVVSTTAAKK